MSTEQNRQVVLGFAELFNQRKIDAVEGYLTRDFVLHDPSLGDFHGAQGVAQYFGSILGAFPDGKIKIEGTVAEGDKVCKGPWVFTGTHTAEMPGNPPIPATGKKVEVWSLSLYRLSEGKIVELWMSLDQLALLKQLGVVPG